MKKNSVRVVGEDAGIEACSQNPHFVERPQ